jgi:hypothetical protein
VGLSDVDSVTNIGIPITRLAENQKAVQVQQECPPELINVKKQTGKKDPVNRAGIWGPLKPLKDGQKLPWQPYLNHCDEGEKQHGHGENEQRCANGNIGPIVDGTVNEPFLGYVAVAPLDHGLAAQRCKLLGGLGHADLGDETPVNGDDAVCGQHGSYQ